jgi:hypothetical protein
VFNIVSKIIKLKFQATTYLTHSDLNHQEEMIESKINNNQGTVTLRMIVILKYLVELFLCYLKIKQ